MFAGVDVRVTSNGRILPLYDDPNADENHDQYSQCYYMEAITGAPFSVTTCLTPDFKIAEGRVVRVNTQFDGAEGGFYYDIKDVRQRNLGTARATGTIGHIVALDPSTKKWVRGECSFGRLDVKETSDITMTPSEAQGLGKIQTTIKRVHVGPVETKESGSQNLKWVTEVSEKALKGRGVIHTVKCDNYTPSAAPPLSTKSTPVAGALGIPIVITIFYRSKRTLQMLGCIPRDPSPEPGPISSADPDRDEKLNALRARIASLESAQNVKPERKTAHNSVKRERADTEATEVRSKRSKTSRFEVIDLTSD